MVLLRPAAITAKELVKYQIMLRPAGLSIAARNSHAEFNCLVRTCFDRCSVTTYGCYALVQFKVYIYLVHSSFRHHTTIQVNIKF